MKAVIFLADGFEEIEALTPWDVLKRAGTDVTLVSVSGKDTVTGSHGLVVKADTADIPDAGLYILPGGMPGTNNLMASKKVTDTVLKASRENKFIGAICAAPSVLGSLGLLENKKAVCFPGFENKLTGYIKTDAKVVRDGNIITAKGMGVSLEFALALTEALYGKEKAESIKASVQA